MKIEMGESLVYSWLRHVQKCQIVQTNWKTSPEWSCRHEGELDHIMTKTSEFFLDKYGYNIYKRTSSVSQLLRQAESDAIGVNTQGDDHRVDKTKVYAVDVAFHEGGLSYGDRRSTVMKVIAKMLRTAMCIYGYFDTKDADIIFASPKVNYSILIDLKPCIEDVQKLMTGMGFEYEFRLVVNKDFETEILNPVLSLSDKIADESELFLRGYKMIQMYE